MEEMRNRDERFKIVSKLTYECILLQERNATEQDMEIWRQTIRERYPADWNIILHEIKKRFSASRVS